MGEEELDLFLVTPCPELCGCGEVAELAKALSGTVLPGYPTINVRLFHGGHDAGLRTIAEAMRQLHSGSASLCLVGSIHSRLCPWHLSETDGLGEHSSNDRRWGLIPGEAASFLLLTTRQTLPFTPAVDVWLHSITAAPRDDRAVGSVCVGRGLTDAAQGALAKAAPAPLPKRVFADYNGWPERAEELGFVLQRIVNKLAPGYDVLTPADRCGEIGCAFGPVFTALVWANAQRGYAAHQYQLLLTSEYGSSCQAAMVEVVTHSTNNSNQGIMFWD